MLLVLLTTLLASLVMGAPLGAQVGDEFVSIESNAWGYGTGGGIIGLIVLILDILVFIEVFKSSRPPAHKILWSLFVFFFPVIGLIVYYLFSNRAQHTQGSYEALP